MRNVKLSLLDKNYGLPLDETVMNTASRPSYYYRTGNNYTGRTYEYPATYHIVDSDRLRIRKGDIVRIADSYIYRKNVRGEFGVVLDRYRIVKQKVNGTFKDYYAIVLISTGEDKGQLLSVGPHRLSGLSKNI